MKYGTPITLFILGIVTLLPACRTSHPEGRLRRNGNTTTETRTTTHRKVVEPRPYYAPIPTQHVFKVSRY